MKLTITGNPDLIKKIIELAENEKSHSKNDLGATKYIIDFDNGEVWHGYSPSNVKPGTADNI